MSEDLASTEESDLVAEPSGHVAFLFTDIEGSTRAWDADPGLMNAVLERHDRILRAAIADAHGIVFAEGGDAFAAAFRSPGEALAAAVSAQRLLLAAQWPADRRPAVRMGIHIGASFERNDNYYGPTLNRGARIMATAHGGQVVLSSEAAERTTELPPGTSLRRLGSYSLKDIVEPVTIYQVDADGLRSDFPPLSTLDRKTLRLPRTRTGLIGRSSEIVDVTERLLAHGVVTIVATGGTGKTRLAQEVADRAGGFFPDGVHLVELEDVGEAGVLGRIVATVLGDARLARSVGAEDMLGVLLDHLVPRQTLVVVDNCEHVLGATGAVVRRLVEHCDKLSVLATSRERLGLAAEQVVPLAPLSVTPGHSGGATGDEPSPAAQLFCERAGAADPAYSPAGELEAIERICRSVDGLPLAIELAAARIRTIPAEEIARRLDGSLDILRQPRSARHARHRSLEQAIAWSFGLLEAAEQRALAWSSVFVGGFWLEAFEELVEAAAPDEDGLDLLEALCDKSLIIPSDLAGARRYRLSNPIRRFAAERLEELGSRQQAELAHLAHFQGLSSSAGVALSGGRSDRLGAFRADHDNLVAAITRATARGARRDALAMALGLHTYWEETGNLVQASSLISSALDHDLNEPFSFEGASVLLAYAPMCGNMAQAVELADRLTPALEDDLPPKRYGQLRFALAFLHSARGEPGRAGKLWSDAGRQLIGTDDHFARSALLSAAHSATYTCRFDEAAVLLDEALAVAPPRQQWFEDLVGVHRSLLAIAGGAGAIDQLVRAAGAVERHDLRFRLLLASVDTTMGAFLLGAEDVAERWWRRLLQLGLDMGHVWAALFAVEFAAWSALASGDDLGAAVRWGCVDHVMNELGFGLWALIRREHDHRVRAVGARDPGVLEEGFRIGADQSLQELADELCATSS